MKAILSSRVRDHMKRLGVFLITLTLIVGVGSCDGGASCGGGGDIEYDLTVSSTEGGEVVISGEGSYRDGTVVMIEAVADECYEFVMWTGADVADPYSPITTITMDEAKSVTASFALLSYDLTANSTGGGAVTSPGEDTFTYDCGMEVALVATAEEGYYFVSWSGDVDTIGNINAPATTITMMGDYSITANFELIPPGQFVLTTSSTAGGSVTAPGEGNFPYDEGAVVGLVAEAEDCHEFVNWSGDVDTVADVYSASTNITMDADKSVTANFALLSYNLTVDSTDGGDVTSPGEGTSACDCGTVVELVAEADLGWHFVEWTGDTSTIGDVDAAETTITMSGDYSITANFGLFSGGNGTAEDPYQIADWYGLDNIRNYLSSHFILTNDLDSNSIGYTELASAAANEGKGWQPLGSTAGKFVGSFNGDGYEICDLLINRAVESGVGLFGVIGDVGGIEHVGVSGNVTGYNDVGALVGKNEGVVSSSYATGRVIGDDYVGGLMGKNEGTASNCSASSSVTGDTRVGGLVGQNSDTVSDSYATGSVTGSDYVGGLAGRNEGSVGNSCSASSVTGDDYVGGLVGKNDGTAGKSYSTGSVTGNTHFGGLVGQNNDIVEYSFWDTQTSGQDTSDGGTGKTTTEMKDISTFSGAGWNIVAVDNADDRNAGYIWNIVDDETYPFLSWQPV